MAWLPSGSFYQIWYFLPDGSFYQKTINIYVVSPVGYIASYQENITSTNPANRDSLLEHMNSPVKSAKSSIYAGVPFPT